MKLYRYILAHDTGRAHCVDHGVVTLATCKPQIRRGAKVGDWIAGFMPRPHARGELVYAGRVAEIIDWTQYAHRHPDRLDAVYRYSPQGALVRLDPDYHDSENERNRDLSGPVLLLDTECSWYFGSTPISLPWDLQHLAARGRGHRVSGTTSEDIESLEKWLRDGSAPGVHAAPRTPDQRYVRTGA